MQLDEFISETLSQIQRGVADAIEKTKDVKGVINPVWLPKERIGKAHVQIVEFDVAVTAVEKESGGASGGVRVLGASLGAEAEKERESSRVSRVRFSIPIVPTVQLVRPDDEADVQQSA